MSLAHNPPEPKQPYDRFAKINKHYRQMLNTDSPPNMFGYMAGSVKILGNIVDPVTNEEDWGTEAL